MIVLTQITLVPLLVRTLARSARPARSQRFSCPLAAYPGGSGAAEPERQPQILICVFTDRCPRSPAGRTRVGLTSPEFHRQHLARDQPRVFRECSGEFGVRGLPP